MISFVLKSLLLGRIFSKKFGYTFDEIIKAGFDVKHQIETAPHDDSPEAISESIGKTIQLFFWFLGQKTNSIWFFV